jgi:hypothetical protein
MKHILIVIIIIAFFLVGCDQDIKEIPVDYVLTDLSIPSSVDGTFISLPTIYEGIEITWESSHPDIVSISGQISRVYQDTHVILTAHYVFNQRILSKAFTLTIKGQPLTSIEIVTFDADSLHLESEVDYDLLLPTSGPNGSLILWESSEPHIISKKGIYYMPIDETHVELTATLIYEDARVTKTFMVIALAMPDIEKVNRDYLMLDISLSSPNNDLLLPLRGYFTSDITWSSSHPEIIDDQGHYVKPIGSISVILTATLTKGESTMMKTFTIPVEGYDLESFFQEVQKKLTINHGISVLFEDVDLPTTILDIASVSWESSHPEVLSSTGIFQYPDHTTELSMKAHVTSGDYERDYFFNYIVYGKNDQQTEHEAKNLVSIPLDVDALYHLDSKENLASGIFENVMMKEGKLLIQGGQLNGIYTSPILHSEVLMNRINLMWGSISHPTAKTEFLTRYLLESGWTPWVSHGIWGYGGDNLPPSITAHFANPTQDIQYKIILTKTTASQPSPQITFVSIQPVFTTPKDYSNEVLRNEVLYQVPQLKQADTLDAFLWNNICWATSISMMLQYYDKLTDLNVPQEYYSVLIRQGTERFGTTKNDIGATQFGVILHELEFHSADMLLYVLDHYGPLIVGVSKGDSPDGTFGPLTYSSGHVIVVVGYEINNDGSVDIIVNDPAVSWMRYTIRGSLDEFMLVWDKGAMLMTPYL